MPWRKQKPQVTPVIDELPRQCGLPVSHPKPNYHSHFLQNVCVCKLSLIPPSLAVISQGKSKPGNTKLLAKHSPEGTEEQLLMRTRGKRETARTCENIHPISSTSWRKAEQDDELNCSWQQRLQLYCPQTPTPALPHRALHCGINTECLREALMGRSRAQRGTKGPGSELGAAGNWRKDQLSTEVLLFMHH